MAQSLCKVEPALKIRSCNEFLPQNQDNWKNPMLFYVKQFPIHVFFKTQDINILYVLWTFQQVPKFFRTTFSV